MSTGVIFDIARFAIHDGPGIRTSVFLKGCPLSCWWCHNPESQSASVGIFYRARLCIRCGSCIEACPERARSLSPRGVARDRAACNLCGECAVACPSGAVEKVGRTVTAPELMDEIERDTPFFDQSRGGVTFSGGEPLTQPDFLCEMLDRCGKHDIHRAVDTCGFAAPAVLEPIVHVEINAPGTVMGDITADLATRRARIDGNEARSRGRMIVSAYVPLAEVTDYQNRLKALTGGEGSFTLQLSHYDPVPPRKQQELASAWKPAAGEE